MSKELDTKEKKQQFYISYIVFVINGMLALSIGSLLPFLREARGLDYAFAGMMVSIHSVGNLLSSFLAGALPTKLGRKKSILLFNSFCAIAYLLMIVGTNRWLLLLAFFMTGLARGAASNFNNKTINNLAPGKTWMINGLHAMFSVGAFFFPLLLLALTAQSWDNWIYACYFMLAMGILSWILYAVIPVEEEEKVQKEKEKPNLGFLKEPIFLLCAGTMFFYLCVEQGVIGWLITYFKDSGFLEESLAQVMASVLWIMILAGRLTVAWLSTKVKRETLLVAMGIGFVVFCFLLLIGRSPVLIVVGILGFGYSMAGIYPTTVSMAGKIIKEYPLSWSFLLTFASLGSILMPSIIGRIAEESGIVYGMSSLVVVALVDLALIITLAVHMRRKSQD